MAWPARPIWPWPARSSPRRPINWAISRLLAEISLVLVFAGLGFRITAVPFHFYAPDVYQGTTNANAGLLAVFPKIVGFVALVRLLVVAMPGMEDFRLARGAGAGRAHDDAGQPAGPVAGQPPPADGLFVDRAMPATC